MDTKLGKKEYTMKKKKFSYIKAFKELNKNIDEDYEKLSDKVHELELSHKRKHKLLDEIKDYIIDTKTNNIRLKFLLLQRIDYELDNWGRKNYGAKA